MRATRIPWRVTLAVMVAAGSCCAADSRGAETTSKSTAPVASSEKERVDPLQAAGNQLEAIRRKAPGFDDAPRAGSALPAGLTPLKPATGPAPAPFAPSVDPTRASKKAGTGNWLVDGVMGQTRGEGGATPRTGRRHAVREQGGPEDGTAAGEGQGRRDEQKADASEERDARRRPAQDDPLRAYLREWMVPDDFRLLVKTLPSGGSLDTVDSEQTHAAVPWRAGLDGAFVPFGGLAAPESPAGQAKIEDNPYLKAMQAEVSTDVPTSLAGSQTSAPDARLNDGNQQVAPVVPPPPAASVPPPATRDDPLKERKYFPQLKRF